MAWVLGREIFGGLRLSWRSHVPDLRSRGLKLWCYSASKHTKSGQMRPWVALAGSHSRALATPMLSRSIAAELAGVSISIVGMEDPFG